MTPHKLKITGSGGADTKIELNGQKLQGVKNIIVRVEPTGTEAIITLVVDPDIDTETALKLFGEPVHFAPRAISGEYLCNCTHDKVCKKCQESLSGL